MKNSWLILVMIIAVAAVFCFWALDRHDVITDEASYIVRGISMLDFNYGIEQPTPIQQVTEVPWWMRLSFHDHPPLVFILEHASAKIFGENLYGVRIPPVVFGLLAVVFLYLIGRELYSRKVGLLSASLFAFTVSHVWISRTALLEPVVIALMLASAYVFILSLKRVSWLPLAGTLLGLAFIAKYTAIILIPAFLTIIFIRRREFWAAPNSISYFFLSFFCFLIVAGPVIIYNIGLYKTFGHFDFQLSYLFGQEVQGWELMPGKDDAGSMFDRLKSYLPSLLRNNSFLFLLVSLFGIDLAVRRAWGRGDGGRSSLLLVLLFWIAAFLMITGPADRFVVMLTPWLALFAGAFIARATEEYLSGFNGALPVICCALVFIEIIYTYNSVIAIEPFGKSPWTYAEIREYNHNWGYNQLEDFISAELDNKRPEIDVGFDYPVIKKLLGEAVAKDTAGGLAAAPWAVVYNGNMSLAAQLWTFLRRAVHHGWPVIDVETYKRVMTESGGTYFKELGIKKIYFVNNTGSVKLREVRTRPYSDDGNQLEEALLKQDIPFREIKNSKGDVTFRVYEFAP